MKSYAVIVLVVATVTLRHVNARVASGVLVTADTNNEVTTLKCPYKAVPDTINTVPFIMLNKVKDCYKSSDDFKRQIASAHDTDAYRRLLGSACTKVPSVKTCIAAVAANAEACLSEVERKMLATVLDFLGTCIKETCADGGEVVATMFGEEFKVMTLDNKHLVLSCLHATVAQTLFDREADLPAYTLRKYRAFKSGKQCILNVAKRGHTSANQMEHFLDKLIRSLKCLTPETNEIVSCETLEADHSIDE